MARNVKTDELDQLHDYNIYTPSRIITLFGEIDDDSAMEFIKNIRLLDHVSDKDITVLINTPGGDVHQGMAIFDAIKECNSKVITHAVGPTCSMGAVVLQAGDWRSISSNSILMIHVGSEGIAYDHTYNVKRWTKEYERIGNIMTNILFEKMKIKNPKFTKKQFNTMMVFDTILSATESLKYGLVDEIKEHKGYEQK